jgi:hypothetical protein
MDAELGSSSLREEDGQNKILGRLFDLKKEEVTREWRKLHNAELHNL